MSESAWISAFWDGAFVVLGAALALSTAWWLDQKREIKRQSTIALSVIHKVRQVVTGSHVAGLVAAQLEEYCAQPDVGIKPASIYPQYLLLPDPPTDLAPEHLVLLAYANESSLLDEIDQLILDYRRVAEMHRSITRVLQQRSLEQAAAIRNPEKTQDPEFMEKYRALECEHDLTTRRFMELATDAAKSAERVRSMTNTATAKLWADWRLPGQVLRINRPTRNVLKFFMGPSRFEEHPSSS